MKQIFKLKENLIYLKDNKFVIVSETTPTKNDWVIDKQKNIYYQETDKVFENFTGAKKIIATIGFVLDDIPTLQINLIDMVEIEIESSPLFSDYSPTIIGEHLKIKNIKFK